jgi:RNA polymerase sigma-70 factor (ECF subfamily)
MGETVIGADDAHLIAETLKGSETAFRRLVERYHSIIHSVVRGVLGDRDDVEDVVQEALIKMYRGLPRFRGDAKFSTWVYRIARNEAIDAVSRRRLETQPLDDLDVEDSRGEAPDEAHARDSERMSVERYLHRLDEHYRIALELRYMGEKSYAEIADAMELPIGTVKTYIHRAKQELRRAMRRTAHEPTRGSNP